MDDASPEPRATFTLMVSVTNEGERSPGSNTTLRYYRSTDAEISGSETEVGTDAINRFPGTSVESISLTAPSTPGTYFYGACVDAVAGESYMTNNCSASVQLDVS